MAVECAGNARSYYTSQQGDAATGTAWTLGAIGVARWRGVRLSDVLRHAGIGAHAVDVMPSGLDADYVTEGVNLGRVRRPLPVAKALDDVILAYEMNGEPLPYDHGYPVRVVVPSWVGIASIKWVGDIEVSAEPLSSPWNTDFYRLFGPSYPPGGSDPLTRQTIKSGFELAPDTVLAAGRTHRLTGRAWSAHAPVRHVEFSTDGGIRWQRAQLRDTPLRNNWVRWSAPWRPHHGADASPGAGHRHGREHPARALGAEHAGLPLRRDDQGPGHRELKDLFVLLRHTYCVRRIAAVRSHCCRIAHPDRAPCPWLRTAASFANMSRSQRLSRRRAVDFMRVATALCSGPHDLVP